MLVSGKAHYIVQRLIAEINELCPNLPLNAAWAVASDVGTGLALAAELDLRAVTQNEPNLRSLADCVRLLCLPLPRDATHFEEYRRVGKAPAPNCRGDPARTRPPRSEELIMVVAVRGLEERCKTLPKTDSVTTDTYRGTLFGLASSPQPFVMRARFPPAGAETPNCAAHLVLCTSRTCQIWRI
jgi:hypothetical protein